MDPSLKTTFPQLYMFYGSYMYKNSKYSPIYIYIYMCVCARARVCERETMNMNTN